MSDEEKLIKSEIQKHFPNLNLTDFEITSPIDFFYNCHAWAAKFDDLVMQPSTNPIYGWLTGESSDLSENFVKQFKLLGFIEQTENREVETNFEKIAFYIDGSNEVRHAARQLENGFWTSKLGTDHDISHRNLECREGEIYGKVGMILKKPI